MALLHDGLLGWAGEGCAGTAGVFEIDPAAVDAITAVMSDGELAAAIRAVTDGRVHRVILSEPGLYAVRHLAAFEQEHASEQLGEELDAQTTLLRVLQTIGERIGAHERAWLNSLKVIGLRLASNANHSVAAAYLPELRRADGARILAPRLFGAGKGGLTDLMNKFGTAETIDTIRAVLARAMIDGMAPGAITTWSYFRPALEEQQRLEEMTAAGLRPGDVFGAHRRRGSSTNDYSDR
jgi:hypothetical protein